MTDANTTRRILGGLRTYWTQVDRLDRGCYALGAVLSVSGLVHLGVQLVTGGDWDGPVSWRKPFDFGLAFGLTLATITWVTTFVRISPVSRARALTAFAIACLAEVAVITVQAWRGVPSHYDTSTRLNAAFAYTAAAGGAAIIVTSLIFAANSFRRTEDPMSMRIAIRAGFVSFLSALAIGALMIVIGTITSRTVSQTAAYTVAAAFKSGHAATMHGVLILPAAAWLSSYAPWSERRRLTAVLLAGTGYVLAAAVVVIDTLIAIDPLSLATAPPISTVLSATGGVCLVAALGWIAAAALRGPAQDGMRARPRTELRVRVA
jgi:hypothetical protein